MVLVIVNNDGDNRAVEEAKKLFPQNNVQTTKRQDIANLKDEEFDNAFISEDWAGIEDDSKFWSEINRVLRKGASVTINSLRSLDLPLMIAGFLNVNNSNNTYTAHKPSFSSGSAVSLATKKETVINPTKKLTLNMDDDDDDLINDDDLLDENDRKVPDASQYDCGPGITKKACKNCTCGLAEKEIKEEQDKREDLKKVIIDAGGVDTEVKSSCGSCYKGDAFRCASCPYLGMPSFKPGEKVLKLDLDTDVL
ncbi:hypothetical protein AKO1_014958 [Acrasis kona]|uniref:Anamorsin homolog n=1 Tax=Acrasis kona TaxID=1008807 RepID=A0AAW2Z7S4_9EUKA